MAELKFVEVQLEVFTRGPLHVGTGYGARLLDRVVMRDAEGHVYIPATTLKGRARDACERLARLHDLPTCTPPRPDRTCRPYDADEPCIVCRVFGGAGIAGGLRWADAHLDEQLRNRLSVKTSEGYKPAFQTYDRTQVSLSRTRGVAQEGLLFTAEHADRDLHFEATLRGWMDLTPLSGEEHLYHELILLVAGLKMVSHLGGARSRGYGACTIKPLAITVDGQACDLNELIEHTENLYLYEYGREEVRS